MWHNLEFSLGLTGERLDSWVMIKLIPCIDFSFEPEPPYKSNTKNDQNYDKDWIPKSLSTGNFFASDKRKRVWKKR